MKSVHTLHTWVLVWEETGTHTCHSVASSFHSLLASRIFVFSRFISFSEAAAKESNFVSSSCRAAWLFSLRPTISSSCFTTALLKLACSSFISTRISLCMLRSACSSSSSRHASRRRTGISLGCGRGIHAGLSTTAASAMKRKISLSVMRRNGLSLPPR